MHRQRRVDGPRRVALVGGRYPEDGHDGVADELLDAAAIVENGLGDALEVAIDNGADLFRVQRLGHGRETGQVREEDGGLFALLGRHLGAFESRQFLPHRRQRRVDDGITQDGALRFEGGYGLFKLGNLRHGILTSMGIHDCVLRHASYSAQPSSLRG